MESNQKDPRHFLKKATNIKDAFCSGRYMRVSIEKLLINVPISGDSGIEIKEKDFTLIRILYTNIWGHRISTRANAVKLIDSDGVQYGHETDLYPYQRKSRIKFSQNRCVHYDFISPEDILEGEAKTRGWLWFPALPPGIYPRRLIFQFYICNPGDIHTPRVDDETLEIVLLPQFKHLLPEGESLVTLEIEANSSLAAPSNIPK
jgi:hypothetical protein